jgi:hypothetical protein
MLKNINLGLVALVLGFGLTFVTSAFKAGSEKSKVNKQWYYQANTVGEANDETKYSLTQTPPTSCQSGDDLPCYIETPEDVDTQAELHDYFVSNYSNSASLINAAASERREAQ